MTFTFKLSKRLAHSRAVGNHPAGTSASLASPYNRHTVANRAAVPRPR
jgi:hypothetical protein